MTQDEPVQLIYVVNVILIKEEFIEMTKIYVISNKINDVKYIGQTSKSLKNRMLHHKSNLKYGKTRLVKAFNDIGFENFYIDLIEEVDDSIADVREYYWILRYGSEYELYNDKYSIGKCGGDTLSNHRNKSEISKKISSQKLFENNPNASSVTAFDIINMNEKTFGSIKECQVYYGIKHHSVISKRCRGIIKKPYNNLQFKYNVD